MQGLLPLLSLLPLASAAMALHPGMPLLPPPPAPAPPASPTRPRLEPAHSGLPRRAEGSTVRVNGLAQQALWRWENGALWLPLELLEGQLGVSQRALSGQRLELQWFGHTLVVPASEQRSLDDEVAVAATPLLDAAGVGIRVQGRNLELTLPNQPIQAIRFRDQGISGRRVVFDLAAPAVVRSDDGQLLIGASANAEQLQQLQQIGLTPRQEGGWLRVLGQGERLSLGSPWRLVLDLPAADGGSATTTETPAPNPRLLALQRQGLQIERQQLLVQGRPVLMHSVRLDPRSVPLDLKPLRRADGMQGLSSLSQLARREDALVAINGGYFNRVNRLPLGALRDQGRWLSGPILNRGAMGWNPAELPRFGRLSLEETLIDANGQRWPVASVNSGFAQKGLARYTADWGNRYQPITGTEMAVLLREGRVQQRFELGSLSGGVPLQSGDVLVVARGGIQLPWMPGERLQLTSRPSDALGQKPFVLGGGPLLLQGGRVVLNGIGEGFSPGFLSQRAPRTLVASDGQELWLVTLQGVNHPGPTLLDAAVLMQQQGLQDALNLDGGSSTGLVLGDSHSVKGRGVAAAVHNGLGLVPREPAQSSPATPLAAGTR